MNGFIIRRQLYLSIWFSGDKFWHVTVRIPVRVLAKY